MKEDELFKATEEQDKIGTCFMAIHTGINNITFEILKRHVHYVGLYSRGGDFISAWMLHN